MGDISRVAALDEPQGRVEVLLFGRQRQRSPQDGVLAREEAPAGTLCDAVTCLVMPEKNNPSFVSFNVQNLKSHANDFSSDQVMADAGIDALSETGLSFEVTVMGTSES